MNAKVIFELLWWGITVVLVLLFVLPIWLNVGLKYPFYLENIAFIIIFVTLARFIFLTRYHWFAWNIKFKLVMIFLMIPLMMFVIGGFTDFQEFVDNYGINSILDHLNAKDGKAVGTFLRTQMVFNWIGAFLSCILMPFAMLRSIWLQKNRNRV